MSQQFCLKWNNHMNNMMDVFKNLLSTESMVDVTLACDGLSLKAHKMVLSACSPFFQSLFLENPCKHPIVILKDMKYSELKAIIEFMYHGEVNVAQDQLSALMKTAETLRVKGLAEVTNEKNTSSSAQDEPGHRSVPRTETPPTPQSKRRRGRVRKRSLSDSNRSDDSNEPKIKQPVSPDIEELSGDITMDNSSGQFSNLQSQVPMQSLPSHSTNSYHKSSSVVSLDPQIEEPASADESEFGVEPAKLLEQTLTTDDLSNRRSGRTSTMSSSMEMSRRPRSSTDHSSIVPVSMPSESMMSNQPPESPPDIKPELLELEPPMSPVAGPSHSTDNSMMMYMDQSSVSSHPGTSYQDNQALVSQDSQPQDLYYCDRCTGVFTSLKVMTAHKESKKHHPHKLWVDSPNKRYRCTFCRYSTNYRSNLQLHEYIHTGKGPFKCSQCNAGFTQYSYFKKHMLNHIHDEDLTKNCSDKKAMVKKGQIKKGKGLKSMNSIGEKKQQKQSTHVKVGHIKKDKGLKNLKSVGEKKQLKQSTPEKTIKPCTKCTKTFDEDNRLQKHMRMHKRKEKPHKCKVCKKRFSTSSNLTKHEKKHNKVKYKNMMKNTKNYMSSKSLKDVEKSPMSIKTCSSLKKDLIPVGKRVTTSVKLKSSKKRKEKKSDTSKKKVLSSKKKISSGKTYKSCKKKSSAQPCEGITPQSEISPNKKKISDQQKENETTLCNRTSPNEKEPSVMEADANKTSVEEASDKVAKSFEENSTENAKNKLPSLDKTLDINLSHKNNDD